MRQFVLLFALLALTGCGGPKGPVTVSCEGTLLKNGRPLQVAQREIGVGQVTLEFIPVDDTGPAPQPYGAHVDAAGKFSMPGGIPPGKYKVVVRQWDPFDTVDRLQGAYAKDKTPLVFDIDGKSPINIDLK